jgi:hypothetical protein
MLLGFCFATGHWIHACPTNDNPDFEGRPRIKRTTGIPKSFLQKVKSGKPVDGQNVMVTSDGSFVIAKPNKLSPLFAFLLPWQTVLLPSLPPHFFHE